MVAAQAGDPCTGWSFPFFHLSFLLDYLLGASFSSLNCEGENQLIHLYFYSATAFMAAMILLDLFWSSILKRNSWKFTTKVQVVYRLGSCGGWEHASYLISSRCALNIWIRIYMEKQKQLTWWFIHGLMKSSLPTSISIMTLIIRNNRHQL